MRFDLNEAGFWSAACDALPYEKAKQLETMGVIYSDGGACGGGIVRFKRVKSRSYVNPAINMLLAVEVLFVIASILATLYYGY